MQRRLFALMAVFAPVAAVAQTTTPNETEQQPRRPIEKSWAELTRRQRERLLPGFGTPAPKDAEAGARWDAMDMRQRRIVVRAVRQPRDQSPR